jgi:hypothetical protein
MEPDPDAKTFTPPGAGQAPKTCVRKKLTKMHNSLKKALHQLNHGWQNAGK